MKKKQKKSHKIKRSIIAFLIVIGVLWGAGIVLANLDLADKTTPPKQPTEQVQEEPKLVQDPTVVGYMQTLGLDYSKLNLYLGASDSFSDSKASFIAPNNIYLSPSVGSDQLYIVLSHEYMHYVQSAIDVESAESYYPYMNDLMNSDDWFHNRTAYYRDRKYCTKEPCLSLEAELEAVACTELPDYVLKADFIAWCNKHLPQRYSLF
jgi:hypothetical protein